MSKCLLFFCAEPGCRGEAFRAFTGVPRNDSRLSNTRATEPRHSFPVSMCFRLDNHSWKYALCTQLFKTDTFPHRWKCVRFCLQHVLYTDDALEVTCRCSSKQDMTICTWLLRQFAHQNLGLWPAGLMGVSWTGRVHVSLVNLPRLAHLSPYGLTIASHVDEYPPSTCYSRSRCCLGGALPISP